MRVQGYKIDDAWVRYGFDTTYNMGWENCLAYAKKVYEFMNHPEVLISPIAGAGSHQIEIKEPDDIWDIPEAGCIIVRGSNQIFDEIPFQFMFVNQLTQVYLDMPANDLNSFKNNKGELLDDEEKKHIFDKYMDSIEIIGEVSLYKHRHLIDD